MAEGVILCVDDEETILDSLDMQLQSLFGTRFLVELALSAGDAWEILESYQCNQLPVLIIITDWQMPLVKGDEFLVEAHRRFPTVIKIMLSGQASPEAVRNAKTRGGLFRFIDKPWQPEDLRQAIEDGLAEGSSS
ncbi:MAG: response regulator [Wenzhouxiangella sp.]|nr:response regulator [Wenzhouxiangella sp.]